jgi:hypothetical protein
MADVRTYFHPDSKHFNGGSIEGTLEAKWQPIHCVWQFFRRTGPVHSLTSPVTMQRNDAWTSKRPVRESVLLSNPSSSNYISHEGLRFTSEWLSDWVTFHGNRVSRYSVLCDYVPIRSHRKMGEGFVRICRFHHSTTRITLNTSVMYISKTAWGEVILNA